MWLCQLLKVASYTFYAIISFCILNLHCLLPGLPWSGLIYKSLPCPSLLCCSTMNFLSSDFWSFPLSASGDHSSHCSSSMTLAFSSQVLTYASNVLNSYVNCLFIPCLILKTFKILADPEDNGFTQIPNFQRLEAIHPWVHFFMCKTDDPESKHLPWARALSARTLRISVSLPSSWQSAAGQLKTVQ